MVLTGFVTGGIGLGHLAQVMSDCFSTMEFLCLIFIGQECAYFYFLSMLVYYS